MSEQPDDDDTDDRPRREPREPVKSTPKPKAKGSKDIDPNWGHFLGVGLQIAVGAGLGYVVGHWLDGRFGWTPMGTLIGTMLGVTAGIYLLIKDAMRFNRD